MSQQKRKTMYVTKLKAGQKVKSPKGEFVVKNDEISIYVPEDVSFKAGDKLYLNPVQEYFTRLSNDKKITPEQAQERIAQCQAYNQSYIVSIWNKK